MAKPKNINDLKPAPYNPRSIQPEALEGLKTSVAAFGDISGLVFNTKTNRLVCGHQRLEALKRGQKVKYDPKVGAVVTEAGESFRVRLVDWDEDTEKAANVAANSSHIAGDWTEGLGPVLDEIETKLPDLYDGLRLEPLKADMPFEIPSDNKDIDEDELAKTGSKCPSCGFEW